jgi:5'-nucleotidase
MNEMGVDVSTFGNHEHDRNLAHLKTMIKNSDFQWVVSNYSSLAGLKATSKKFVKNYTLVKRGGVTVGFVGMNTPETPTVVFPGNLDFKVAGKNTSIKISASVASTNKAVAAAKAAGADIVVALLHEGWTNNEAGVAQGGLLEVANQLKGVTAIYGAHSHNTYASYVKGVLTAQVKNAGVEYNRSQICVNTATNKALGASNELVKRSAVATILPSESATALVAEYKAQTAAKLDVKIGQMTNVAPRGGTPAVERSGEAALGSYIADAVRAKYETDFVLLNGGGIRDTFPATTYVPSDTSLVRPADKNAKGTFDVVLGDAYTVLPFGNSVSIAEVTGANLWAALENGVSGYPSSGAFPQISGFKFTFNPSLPAKSRVTSVTDLKGNPIAKDSTVYTIATVDFLVYGGDGYTQFDPSNVKVRDLLVQVFADAIKADALAGKPTVMATDGRITVVPAG